MVADKAFEGIPSHNQIIQTIRSYHVFKKSCLMSFYDCQGNRHNKHAFEGPYLECGRIDVFGIWKKNVKEQRAKNFVELLMDQYDLPVHEAPKGMEEEINKFYMAKYGMFTCHDVLARMGKVRYPEDLINYWQRNKEDQKYTWYLAVAFVMSEKSRSWDLLKPYKKDFKEGKSFKSYLRNHPDHLSEAADMRLRVEHADYYDN